MRGLRPLVALAIVGVMLLPGAAQAAPTVSISAVSVDDDTGSVTGSAGFDTITQAQSVVGANATHTRGTATTTDVGNAAGVQLVDATITPIANGLRFTWQVSNLPEQVPPEGVRYLWGFKIGAQTFQLIAKRTNMLTANVVDDPVGYVRRLAEQKNFFSLRGACGPFQGVGNVTYCYHLTFLDGGFNLAEKKIFIDLPFEARDSIGRVVAPDFKPGAVLQETPADGIAAALQYGPLTQPQVQPHMQHIIKGTDPYYTAPQVALSVSTPGQADPSQLTYVPAEYSNGTFSGTVKGLSASKNTVYARACNGVECSYSSFKAL